MPTAGQVCVLCLYYVFILFINDLEQVVTSSRVSFFDEDTRVPKRISCLEDCQLLQDDLYKIVDWSRWNNMKLREQKFELPNHLYSKNSVLPELPFHNETLIKLLSVQ